MHLSDGDIRAYLDDELAAPQRQAAQQHLTACPDCQAHADALLARAQFAQQRLAALSDSSPNHAPAPTREARRRLDERLAAAQPITFKEKLDMFKQSLNRLSRPAWAAITLAAVLAIALAFPGVRALGQEFLGLFRVQQVQVLPVDMTGMEQMPGQMSNSRSLQALFKNNVKMQGGGEPEQVSDAATAGQMTGMTVRLPAALENPTIYVQKGGSLAMTLDVALINEVLSDMGHPELSIPDSLDGDQVRVTVPNNVIALYGDCPKPTEGEAEAMAEKAKQGDVPEMPDCVAFMQMPSPTVEAPADLNVGQLGQVYLELMGMEPEKAAEFSKTIDWTSTFVLPMPSNFANYQTKTVDGVEATFIRTFRDGGRGYMLLWVKDGVLYSLTGPGGGDAALDIAASLK